MKVKIHDNYAATKDFKILGYMGEINAREITVEYPQVSDADTYRLRFEYSDGVVYDVPLQDGKMIVTASLIRETGEIKCQWLATKSIDGDYELVAKSQVFRLVIESSIGDEVSPVPTYEMAQSVLDDIKNTSEKITTMYDELNESFENRLNGGVNDG